MGLPVKPGSYLIGLILAASLPPAAVAERDWTTFEDCKLIEDESYDGDSFHVRYKSRHYIFRLYFVDCCETDDRFPERLADQGAYFGGLSEKQVMRAGKDATDFARKWLQGTFTVHTRYRDAMGTSDRKRYFAMVEKDGKFLSEALVEAGHARVFGVTTDPPGGLGERAYGLRLKKLENEAQAARRGAWDTSAKINAPPPSPNAVALQEVVLTRVVPVFNVDPPHALRGYYPQGGTLKVVDTAHGSLVRIQVEHQGQIFEGLVDRNLLPPLRPPEPALPAAP